MGENNRDNLGPRMQRVHDDIERIRAKILHETGVLPSHREVAVKLLAALQEREEGMN
jgi:hypothetical protein